MKLQYNTPIPNSSHEKINVIDLRNIYLILGDDVKISISDIMYKLIEENRILKEK